MANRSRSRKRKNGKPKQRQSSPAPTPSSSDTPAKTKRGGHVSAYAARLKSVPNTTQIVLPKSVPRTTQTVLPKSVPHTTQTVLPKSAPNTTQTVLPKSAPNTTQTNGHKTGAKTQKVKKRKLIHNLEKEIKCSDSFQVQAGQTSFDSDLPPSSSTHQTKRLKTTPVKQKLLKRKRNTRESRAVIKRSRSDTRHNKRINDKIDQTAYSEEIRSTPLLHSSDNESATDVHCSGGKKQQREILHYNKNKVAVINNQSSEVNQGESRKKSKKRTAREVKQGSLVLNVVENTCLQASDGEKIDCDTTVEEGDNTLADDSSAAEKLIVSEDTNDDSFDDSVVVCSDDDTRPDILLSGSVDSALVLNTTCGSQILILPAEQEVNVQGKCRAITLCGTTSVLGYTLKKDTYYDIFSPDSNSLLTFKSVCYESNKNIVQTLYKRLAHDLEDSDVRKLYNFQTKDVTVVRLENIYSGRYDYITTLSPFQQLFGVWVRKSPISPASVDKTTYKSFNLGPGNTSTSVMNTNSYTYKRAQMIWSQALKKENWTNGEAPVIVICGVRNSGKSTLSRYLVNSTLNELDSVMFLECDIGQTEFTPPGCISLHRVSEPVLVCVMYSLALETFLQARPPFCHQREPEYACFYGGVALDDPHHYISCIQECFSRYVSERKKTPLIINTCGWITGFGLDLLVDIMRLARPNIVIQMQINKKGRKNLNPPPLTPEKVQVHQSWLDQHMVENKHITTNHKLYVLNSYHDNFQDELQSGSINRKYRPIEHRNLSLLSYLAMDFGHGMTLVAAIPKRVPWYKIGIHVCHESVSPENILAAVNASIVGLCHTNLKQAKRDSEDSCWTFKRLPVCRYLGFGLVRGIDMKKRELYLVTPLSVNELSEVNLLVKGSVNISDQVLLTQKNGDKLPYVDNTVLSTGATSLVQRRHMPRKL